ncbi:MAG: hypothetical protein DLD55_00535 [candidate division SR1 bacterium]|nr:MAG: hypothetical protein DLD55_00535 [candidate division SR1 bacterium]
MTFLPVSFESEQLALAQERCTSLTEQTINNEAEYLHHIIVKKSDLLLGQTMKNYAEEYLINTTASKFQNGNHAHRRKTRFKSGKSEETWNSLLGGARSGFCSVSARSEARTCEKSSCSFARRLILIGRN